MNVLNALVALDRKINWLLGGNPQETLSSRAYRMKLKHQPVWGWAADAIDFFFFWQDEHCKLSYMHEKGQGRLQLGE